MSGDSDDDWKISASFEAKFELPEPQYWPEHAIEPVRRAFTLTAHIVGFGKELEQIFLERGSDKYPPRHRHRYSSALGVIIQYMKAVGFPPIVQGELLELVYALDELDHGIVRDFLRPSIAPNRPMDSADIWACRAMVAISIDVAVEEGGLSRKRACQLSARHVPFLKELICAPTARSLSSTMENWHRAFQKDQVKSDWARAMFQNRYLHVEKFVIDAEQKGKRQDALAIAVAILQAAAAFAFRTMSADAFEKMRGQAGSKRV